MPLKILQFVPEALPTYRADVTVLFAKYLPRHQIHSSIVGKSDNTPEVAQGYAQVWRGRYFKSNALRELAFFWLCLRTLLQADKSHYDLIQVRDMVPIGFLALLIARVKGIPFTYWVSFLMCEGRIEHAKAHLARRASLRNRLKLAKGTVERAILYRFLLPRARHTFVQSEAMLDYIASHGIAREKMTAVPMGVDMELFNATPLTGKRPEGWQDVPLLAYLGTLNQARKLEHVIDALSLVRRTFPTARLLLIGEASTPGGADALLAYATSQGLETAVKITGWLPSTEAWTLLAGADAAISYVPRNTLFDVSSPTKLLEYLALGMPSVGNDIPDQEYVLRQSNAGWLTASDAPAMAEAMLQILQAPAAARQRAASGPAFIEDHRSYRVLSSQLAARYRALQDA